MASIQKRGKKWVAEIRSKGKYASKSFEKKSEADAWALNEEISLGKVRGVIRGKTFREALKEYGKKVSPAKKGARWEIIRLEKFQRDKLADILLTDLAQNDFEEWIDRQKAKGLKSSSVNREMCLLSSVVTKCRKWKWLAGNPLEGVDRPRKLKPRDRLITDAEFSRILTALGYDGKIETKSDRVAVAAMLALETAMRQGEIFNMRWEHIHEDDRYILLPDTKNGDARKVPLSDKAIEILSVLPRDADRAFPIPQASSGVMFLKAVKTAKVPNATFHDLRHAAITRLSRKLDVLALARMVGHKDPRQLMSYYNPTMKDLAERINGVS